MTTAIGAIAPAIKLDGAALDQKWLDRLIQLRVDRGACLVGRATLRFSDNGYSLSASDLFALGKKVAISQPGGGSLFEGTVTGIDLAQSANALPELTVVIDDAAYKLTRGSRTATYQHLTYPEAIEQVASAHGLVAEVTKSSLRLDYFMQAGSDLEFVDLLTRRLGYSWFVEGSSTLVAKPLQLGTPALTLTMKEQLREFSVRATGLRPTKLSVHGWDPNTQQDVSDVKTGVSAGEPPALLRSYSGARPAQAISAAEATVSQLSPTSAAEARQLATAFYDDWAASAVVAHGTAFVTSALKPGVTVRIAQTGPAAGNYLVTSVEHLYDRSGFVTRFECGPLRPAGLVDTLGHPAPNAGFAVAGLIAAVVTNVDDPENAGRVKVRYAGVDTGNVESTWARVVTLGGGRARGAVFYPEVGDEVLVGFEHADTRRPVVLGGLFSKRNILPDGPHYVADGKVNYRRITSRRNHILEFGDGPEATAEHVLLQLGTKPHKVRLGADRCDIEVSEGVPLTIKAGSAKFDISDAGDVTITGNNVTIKAKEALDLEGGATAKVKARQATVQGSEVQVKAGALGSVEAGGRLTIKGATVGIN
jgi:uncharacterized protein involved in type VI secretion and phage assembly